MVSMLMLLQQSGNAAVVLVGVIVFPQLELDQLPTDKTSKTVAEHRTSVAINCCLMDKHNQGSNRGTSAFKPTPPRWASFVD